MSEEATGTLCRTDARRRARDNITHDEAIDYAARIIDTDGISSREKAVMIFANFINYLEMLEIGA